MAGKLQSVSNEVEARMLKFDNSVKTKRFRPVARIFHGGGGGGGGKGTYLKNPDQIINV